MFHAHMLEVARLPYSKFNTFLQELCRRHISCPIPWNRPVFFSSQVGVVVFVFRAVDDMFEKNYDEIFPMIQRCPAS